MSRGVAIGIDLGTTYSLVTVVDHDGLRAIPNLYGETLTPSAVSVDGGEFLVGSPARARATKLPEATAQSFKRDMGTDRKYTLDGQQLTPQALSAMVLGELLRDVQRELGKPVDDVVITVPAYFDEAQRQATRDAGLIAGLPPSRLLNEPTAAAIAFGLHQRDREIKAVILDLGGGTFDVSVLEIMEEVIEIQSSSGDSRLGGDDFTEAVATIVLAREEPEVALSIRDHPYAWARLLAASERAKIALSSQANAEIALPALPTRDGDYLDRSWSVSREQAEEQWMPLMRRMEIPIRRALRDAELDPSQIDEVLLVGGATRMPCVRRLAAEVFQRMPTSHPDPDRVVAYGAALQAALKAGSSAVDDLVVTDVASFSLGIAVANPSSRVLLTGVFSPVLERGTVIPASRIKRYWTIGEGQTVILVEVFQGEHSLCRDNTRLGELKIEGIPPAPAGAEAIDIRFTYDLNSLLEVEVTVLGTGVVRSLLIEGEAERMTEAEVAEARSQMKVLKFLPRDALPNTAALAKAEALFMELTGDTRETLSLEIADFRAALESHNEELIHEVRSGLLATIERLSGNPSA
ncbi:MAG: Hsp70 family protein [Thermoanaerobaculia bacterium]|nr:Hsp70 family protein [Thermoanaerobaculia bacterium]